MGWNLSREKQWTTWPERQRPLLANKCTATNLKLSSMKLFIQSLNCLKNARFIFKRIILLLVWSVKVATLGICVVHFITWEASRARSPPRVPQGQRRQGQWIWNKPPLSKPAKTERLQMSTHTQSTKRPSHSYTNSQNCVSETLIF